MNNFFINSIFTFFTLFILGRIIAYCLYEIKYEDNFFGGVCTITVSIITIIFSNIMVWLN